MGYISERIVDFINEKYPELKSLSVKLDENEISFDTSEKVLPYLAYTNSLDSYHRLINIFHSPFSEHHKLIPFYIVLALCKREIYRFQESVKPINNDLVVRYKGSRYELASVDIKNEIVNLKSGKGQAKVSFLDFLTSDVTPYHRSFEDQYFEVYDMIQKYRLSESEKVSEIFDTPLYSDKKPQSGVIIFTPKVKFKELFKSLNINGQEIINKVPTVNAKYLTDKHRYKYDWISKTKSDYPLILYSNYLDKNAVFEFKRTYPYLDTLIFDEVEDNFSEVEEVITDYYNELSNENGLRDIYLLISDEKIDLLDNIENKVGKSYKWLATSHKSNGKTNKDYEVTIINNERYNKNFETAYELSYQFKRLFNQFPPQKVIPLYKSFCSLLIRFFSFYSYQDFERSGLKFLEEFEIFTKKYLADKPSLYQEFIDKVNDRVLSLISSNHNQKLDELTAYLDQIKNNNLKTKRIGVVARNNNQEDLKYLQDILNQYPVKLNYYSYSDLRSGKKIKDLDTLILLEFREPLSSTLFTNKFANTQKLFLSKKEYSYYRWKHFKIGKLINKITSFENRKDILNLSDKDAERLINKGDIYDLNISNHLTNPEVLDDSSSEEEKAYSHPENEINFNQLIIEAYRSNDKYSDTNTTKTQSYPDYLIIYRDGDQELVDQNNLFYSLNEEVIKDIKELEKKAKELKEGDEILKIKLPNTSLSELFINKLQESQEFREIYKQAEQWRGSLKYLCDEVGTKKACELISEYINRAESTIENWKNGDTLVPQSHMRVIKALNKICRDKNFNDMPYISDPKKVKESATVIKGTILKLPRILLNISVRKLYDLPKKYSLDDAEEELADEIYQHLDIKKIDVIEKL